MDNCPPVSTGGQLSKGISPRRRPTRGWRRCRGTAVRWRQPAWGPRPNPVEGVPPQASPPRRHRRRTSTGRCTARCRTRAPPAEAGSSRGRPAPRPDHHPGPERHCRMRRQASRWLLLRATPTHESSWLTSSV